MKVSELNLQSGALINIWNKGGGGSGCKGGRIGWNDRFIPDHIISKNVSLCSDDAPIEDEGCPNKLNNFNTIY